MEYDDDILFKIHENEYIQMLINNQIFKTN